CLIKEKKMEAYGGGDEERGAVKKHRKEGV
ncbi:hypothetical protein A2U01_0110107, partial [Trifolium medium]|nr:hypothetical protein [Trifolium medium]